MSSTVDISIIILFKQRDEKLQQALDSSKFAKEIITVENSSIIDFSQVRNQVLKKATYPWVFFLDSDEVITPESIAEIKKIIRNNQVDGVIINRQDVFYNQIIKYGEAGNIKLLRMGKKDKMTWKRPVHEVAIINGIVEDSNIKIIHQAHSSISDFLTSVTSYAEIEAKYRASLNKNPNILQLIIFPIIKFIHNYLLKKGFLDGWRGFSYALMMSLHSFNVRVFQYELKYQRNHAKTA